jgi:YD repeat-containing protein
MHCRDALVRSGAPCWHWVVDCDHLVQPLRLPHRLTAKDMSVQRFAYDRAGRRLEIFFRWKTATQYSPISAVMFQELTAQTNITSLLDKWIKQRRITRKEVRTERKIVPSMLCGFRLIVEQMLR